MGRRRGYQRGRFDGFSVGMDIRVPATNLDEVSESTIAEIEPDISVTMEVVYPKGILDEDRFMYDAIITKALDEAYVKAMSELNKRMKI